MTADQPTPGSCPTCYRRDPRTPLLCDVCRSRLRSWLGDIPDLFEELQRRTDELAEPIDHRPYVATVVNKVEGSDGKKVKVTSHVLTRRAADQVAYLLPAGGSSSPSRTGPVSGSPEPRLPIDLDEVDLTAPARTSTSATVPLAYAEQDEDQVGYLSVATTLDSWAADWADLRGERLRTQLHPDQVGFLSHWLRLRLDDACNEHLAIDEFFEDIRLIHGALSAQLGLFDIPDYKRGVSCPRCNALALVRENGSDFIECCTVNCRTLLTPAQYDEHVKALAAKIKGEKAA